VGRHTNPVSSLGKYVLCGAGKGVSIQGYRVLTWQRLYSSIGDEAMVKSLRSSNEAKGAGSLPGKASSSSGDEATEKSLRSLNETKGEGPLPGRGSSSSGDEATVKSLRFSNKGNGEGSLPGKGSSSSGDEATVKSLRSSNEAKGAGPPRAWRDCQEPETMQH
jgi:hypothetical protein